MKVTTMTSYGLVDDKGREFPTEWRACEWIDPYVEERDDGSVLVRYAIQDESPFEYEWPEGVEFTLFSSGYERDQWCESNLYTCRHCDLSSDDHNDEWFGEDIEPHDFEPVLKWHDRMFWVERYEHGLVRYALTGESSRVDRQWDVAGGVAVLTVPDDVPDPEAFARSVLEEYTDWCNGNVYGVAEEIFYRNDAGGWDADDDATDTCWGFIGSDYTETVIKEGL